MRWTGNLGEGTRDYRGYSRDHTVEVDGKPPILGSSGLSPRSDPSRHNPDELLVGALSACHMLWYLHLASEAGIVVSAYEDVAEGVLHLEEDGSGRFISATLRPHVRIELGDDSEAHRLHELAHRKCFVASSVNFPVRCEDVVERVAPPS